MNLNLNREGRPLLSYSDSQKVIGAISKLNDNKWHHIAVTMPTTSCLLSEIKMFVDGKPINTIVIGNDAEVDFPPSALLGLGGHGHSADSQTDFKPFVGLMDDVYVWTKTLTDDEVKSLVECSISVSP